MSLNKSEKKITSEELITNYKKADLDEKQVLLDLNFTSKQLHEALTVSDETNGFDVWKLKDYIDDKLKERNIKPNPYSILKNNIWYSYKKSW